MGDVVEELAPYSKLKDHPNPKGHAAFNDRRKEELAPAEPNLTLLLEQRVTTADSSEGVVHSVVAQHTRTGRRTRLIGRWYLDSTGDGVLGTLAEADFEFAETGRMGTTNLWSIDDTNETEHGLRCLCEDIDDKLALNFTPADKAQPFPRCPWAVDLTDVDFRGRIRKKTFGSTGIDQLGTWFWASGFDKDPMVDGEWMTGSNELARSDRRGRKPSFGRSFNDRCK